VLEPFDAGPEFVSVAGQDSRIDGAGRSTTYDVKGIALTRQDFGNRLQHTHLVGAASTATGQDQCGYRLTGTPLTSAFSRHGGEYTRNSRYLQKAAAPEL
jgi:hypothetical protein